MTAVECTQDTPDCGSAWCSPCLAKRANRARRRATATRKAAVTRRRKAAR
jgi:hypothetical protein